MPTLNEMRQELYSKYKGQNWKKKVDKMSDNQIIAIWHSIKLRKEKENGPKQLSLFEDENG